MPKEINLYGFETLTDGSTQPLQDERNQPDGYCVYVTCDLDGDREVEIDEDFKTYEEARDFSGKLQAKYPSASCSEYSIPFSERSFFP